MWVRCDWDGRLLNMEFWGGNKNLLELANGDDYTM